MKPSASAPLSAGGERKLARLHCAYVPAPIVVDGNLCKRSWEEASRSERFVDLVTGEPSQFNTQVAALFDEENLYFAYWIEEPQVRATLTERDSFIWNDNDVELFIAGVDCYYELAINAFGTVYEAFFIWQDALKKGSRFDLPQFDLYARNVDMLAGFQDASRWNNHPRGRRWAFLDFDFPGLKTAVQVQGKINDAAVIDQGWTVEIALPWRGMELLFPDRRLPPAAGSEMRCDFSRFQSVRRRGQPHKESLGWALNVHGVWDSHLPECFSHLRFLGK